MLLVHSRTSREAEGIVDMHPKLSHVGLVSGD